MKMELGTKIDYLGNVYEYIGNESDSDSKMIFQSVNDDSYIVLTEKDFKTIFKFFKEYLYATQYQRP